jgi:ribosomal protein S12 methylthiotransferase
LKKRFYLLSLGCPKNTVDSEGVSNLLKDAGWKSVTQPRQADLLIVNTCGFIESAREESYAMLRELAVSKRPGQRLLAIGCLSQRYGSEVQRRVPGVDGCLGTREWANIVSCAEQLMGAVPTTVIRPHDQVSVVASMTRQAAGASAYVKIADGCSAPCAFCSIPLIKGPQRSKPRAAILQEARELVSQGVQEIILIAQDTTAYGRDLGQTDALPELIASILESVPQLPWLRLMYAYPQHITADLIATMASQPQVCHYLDLPLQHAHPDTLRRMKRSPDVSAVRQLISSLRQAMPDIALRTAFIVGYPGETEAEFDTLLQFMAEIRFDKVGVFRYSPEDGTAAIGLPGRVAEEVSEQRYAQAMELQRGVSLQRNRLQVGRMLSVLVEGTGEGMTVGRCYRDAPEIDGYVLLRGEWEAGNMVRAHIEQAMEYDLVGNVLPD